MSINLLEIINEHVSGDVISKLAEFVGESPKNTTSALSNAIPSLLAGLVSKSSDSEGASSLFSLLSQSDHDGSLLNNLAGAFSGGEGTNKLLSTGTTLLNSILGSKADGVVNLIANASGISKTSSGSLLGLLTPMILGILGKTVKAQGINSATGLASLLGGQGGFLKNFLPAGLTGILGLAGLAGADKKPYTAATTPYIEEDEDGGFGKWLPWLLLPAILGLGWGLLKYFQLPKETTPATSIQETTLPAAPEIATPAVVEPKAEAPVAAAPEAAAPTPETASKAEAKVEAPAVVAPVVEAVAPVADAVKNVFEKALPTGFVVKADANGIENKLIGFLEDANKKVDKDTWFTMNGIEFDTGKSTLRPSSKVQINNIVEIMKAFPKVKIKIGGYTDNTGKAKANIKLSGDRAVAVKKALIAAGIDAKRFAAKGFGSEHPVATNDTAEGRQQNRRIDVNVTAK